ncbi:MAG: hypothetical protein DRN66_00280 [Candidatus Nanohalarchaeota archaeon]|nr:MAG: hypothetical protein DRN66_00280 [Candidatus Nanohaloarchaeota archaeon]
MRLHFRVIIISALAIYFLSSLGFASFIKETSLKLNVNEDNTIDVKMTIDYASLSTNDVSFVINGRIPYAKGSDKNGEMNCSVHEKPYGTQIICKRKENIQINYSATILYKMSNVIFEEKKMNKTIDTFLFEYNIVEPTEKLHILLIIPAGYGLLDAAQMQAYYPPNPNIRVIDGRRVGVEWTEQNLSIGKSYFFKANYEKISNAVINNEDYPRSYKIIMSVVVVGLLCLVVLLLFSKAKKIREKKSLIPDEDDEAVEGVETEEKKEEEKKNIEDVMLISLLKEDEKKVFDLICASSGGISKQREIARATGFSPAKTSHVIKSLSARGLINLTRQGRTTRIEFTEKANEFLKTK